MSLTYRQITATLDDAAGNAQSGTVSVVPSANVYASGVPVMTAAVPVEGIFLDGQLYAAGSTPGDLTPFQLLPQDETGLTIDGMTGFWYYTATVVLDGTTIGPWSFTVESGAEALDLWSTQGTAYTG